MNRRPSSSWRKRALRALPAVGFVVWCAAAAVAQETRKLTREQAMAVIVQEIATAGQSRRAGRPIVECRTRVEHAVRVAGTDSELLRGCVVELTRAELPELAIQLAPVVLRSLPGDVVVEGTFGTALLALKKYPEAIGYLQTAARGAPREALWWTALARAHLAASQETEALAAARNLTELPGFGVAGLELRAECEFRNSRIDSCLTSVTEILAKDAKNPFALEMAIRTRRMLGQVADALRAADSAITILPTSSRIRLERGLALLAADRVDDAVRDLEAAVVGSPDSVQAHVSLARAYLRAGNREKAANEKKRAMELERQPP